MDLIATYEFDAPVQKVWELLMDTGTVGECLPGCRGLKPTGEDTYEVELNSRSPPYREASPGPCH